MLRALSKRHLACVTLILSGILSPTNLRRGSVAMCVRALSLRPETRRNVGSYIKKKTIILDIYFSSTFFRIVLGRNGTLRNAGAAIYHAS